MPLVATLMSHPKARRLTPALANKAAGAVHASAVDWLAEAVACDLDLAGGADMAETEAILRRALDGEPIDVAVQERGARRKRLLIADMDSTMIEQECIDELADLVGLKAHVAAITARSMNGEIAFEPALRERVALLRDLPVDVIATVLEARITLASGALELVATMRAHGAWTALVSGGFTAFTGPVAERIGFDEHRGNTLLSEAGKLSGLVAEPILGRSAKAEALREITQRLDISLGDAIAVGDGANDLDMLRLAGAGVALHAKPAVAAEAQIRIDHADLTALLYLQGYRREEFKGNSGSRE